MRLPPVCLSAPCTFRFPVLDIRNKFVQKYSYKFVQKKKIKGGMGLLDTASREIGTEGQTSDHILQTCPIWRRGVRKLGPLTPPPPPPATPSATNSEFQFQFHPRRRNVTTSMVGLRNGHIREFSPQMVNPRDIIMFVCWLLNVPATCQCISETDLLRQLYVLLHRDRSCRPVTIY